VAKLPDRLQDISRPVVLTGTVAGETPEGLTRIRTAAGEVLLDSPTSLPVDKPVTLQITPGSTQGQPTKPTALILLQSLATPSAAGSASGTPSPTIGGSQTPSVILPTPSATPAVPTLPMLTVGTVVPALVLAAATSTRPPPASGSAAPNQPTLPGSTTAAPPAGSSGSAAAPPAGGAAAQTPASGAAASPSASAPLSSAPMPDASVELGGDAAHPGAETPTLKPTNPDARPEAPDLPRGATVALKILTVTLPQANQPNQPPDAGQGQARQPGGQGGDLGTDGGQRPAADGNTADLAPDTPILRGTVAGTTPQGQPILATKQGMLALNVPASLPQGSTVTAALTDLARATQAAAPPGGDPLAPMSERDWPALRLAMAALLNSDPTAARALQATMPQPNRKLTAALSFFMAAIQGGDARSWLGEDATSALEKSGRRDLLAQLEKDFETVKQQAAEPLPGDWRPYTLPMMDANGVKPIHVYVHPLKGDEEGGEGREKAKPGSRFLIDVEMSRLGPMQLDGLVRPNHFDLILRSHAGLPPDLRVQLIQVFADSVRAVGYSGGLSFQSGAKSWVKLTRAGRAGLGVSA
jgi:hypothetical protein